MPEKKTARKIEEELKEKLSGYALKNAMDFVGFMKANEMPPDSGDDNWFKYQGENICLIITGHCEPKNMSGNGDNWSVFWANCEVCWGENGVVDKELEDFAHARINPCGKCPCEHSPGIRKRIFGKAYENSCYSTFCFDNPDAGDLEHIKTLAKMRKQNIADMKRAE
ncbi:MAG: hypothetical protein FWF08_00905 [Oscillospiraceae bacterium]|nr:hypothetical protein [Oscillospiraceae bacterium]